MGTKQRLNSVNITTAISIFCPFVYIIKCRTCSQLLDLCDNYLNLANLRKMSTNVTQNAVTGGSCFSRTVRKETVGIGKWKQFRLTLFPSIRSNHLRFVFLGVPII
jgi:hypothetical protein